MTKALEEQKIALAATHQSCASAVAGRNRLMGELEAAKRHKRRLIDQTIQSDIALKVPALTCVPTCLPA
eukprot:CAMPEP_0175098418 /NCGR_PEP_ID=MMETSP0086_2-20121207/5855_1 /TAXON_ID=136419 /ORGANISM="Unknown Unknown, Strain D1" /LENGTH=68 /DNA_ID=CAMNT_0016372085 /DNA_START=32 /DNA_END=238 /DNA_ORIENTATION=+